MDSDIVATINCGWDSATTWFYRKYFNQYTFDRPAEKHDIKELRTENMVIGYLNNDPTKKIEICIKYYEIDGLVIGLWYPVSAHCEFDMCRTKLKEVYPGSIHCGHLTNIRADMKEKDIGFVDCGSLFHVMCNIDEYNGLYNKIGDYAKYYHECLIGRMQSIGNNTTIQTQCPVINGKKYVIWHISSMQGNMDTANEYISKAYPNATRYNIDEYETFLKQALNL